MSNESASFFSRSRLNIIAVLAGPILVAMLTQNLMGVIDTMMIGRLGDSALAAVGLAGNQFFLLFSLLMGLSSAVQAMTSRRLGEGRHEDAPAILNGGIVIAITISLAVLVLGYSLLPFVLNVISDDNTVVRQGQAYLYTILPSALIGGLAVAFGGYWVGISKPHLGLIVVVVQLICNTLFNYTFIFGNFGFPRLETAGAGLGTSLANLVGLGIHAVIAMQLVGRKKFLRCLPEKVQMQRLVGIAAPMSIQQFLFALGIVIFFAIVNLLGTKTLAAFNVVTVIMLTLFLLSAGLGTAATTLVGRALGEQKPEHAKQWAWEVACIGLVAFITVATVMIIFAEPILKAFIVDESTRSIARLPLKIMAITLCIEGFGRIISLALVGAGAAAVVLRVSFINQWVMRLPFYWLIGVYFEQGLIGIFMTMFVAYVLQTIAYVFIWQQGKWAEIKI